MSESENDLGDTWKKKHAISVHSKRLYKQYCQFPFGNYQFTYEQIYNYEDMLEQGFLTGGPLAGYGLWKFQTMKTKKKLSNNLAPIIRYTGKDLQQ